MDKIAEGQSEVLHLKSGDAYAYIRARDALKKIEKIESGIDGVLLEYVEAYELLKGKASVLEACREWATRHEIEIPQKTVADATEAFKLHCVTSGKSGVRRKEIGTVMDKRLVAERTNTTRIAARRAKSPTAPSAGGGDFGIGLVDIFFMEFIQLGGLLQDAANQQIQFGQWSSATGSHRGWRLAGHLWES